tara:strand:+ start:5040 stop:5948 length:909 start_codon:yes stop_codon:yes gene_type:complete
MKIVFFGNHIYGYYSLTEMISNQIIPDLVVTNIPRKQEIVWYPSVAELASSNNIELIRHNRIDSSEEVITAIEDVMPDLLVVSSYRNIIPDNILKLARLGAINLHMAPLPKYRGVHPENWALINGEDWMGYTVHYLDSGIDTGDIIAQDRVPILPEDDILSLTYKISEAAPKILIEVINDIGVGHIVRKTQDESQATYYPPRKPSDGLIDWSMEDTDIQNLIRALTRPYPGAYTIISGYKLTVWRSRLVNGANTICEPGQIIELSSSGILVGTGSKPILLTDFIWDGGELPDDLIGETIGSE